MQSQFLAARRWRTHSILLEDGGDRGDQSESEYLTRLTTNLTGLDQTDQIGLVADQTNTDQTIKVTGSTEMHVCIKPIHTCGDNHDAELFIYNASRSPLLVIPTSRSNSVVQNRQRVHKMLS